MSLPVVVQSTGDLPTWIQLLFCNELRKDAFDGGEKWIGSHTFIKVFHSFVAEPLWACPDVDSWNSSGMKTLNMEHYSKTFTMVHTLF